MKEPIEAAATRPVRRQQRLVELISICLLSLAGVATSWSSYQAARWGGVQATEYSRASGLRVESTRASALAGQLRAVDIAMFMAWIDASAEDNARVADFYQSRFRAEFRPAFEAWLASRPLLEPAAASSPFELDQYELPEMQRAAELDTAAEAAFADGQTANQHSDGYVLNAVLLASVLFFSGIVQQFRIPPVQFVLLSIASVLLIVGLMNIAVMPKLL